jgi:signal peptidase I
MDNQFSDARTASTPSVTPAESPPPASISHPKPALSELLHARLKRLGVSMLVLAVVWVVALVVLRADFLVGLRTRDALGFATVITLIASFFLRSVIPGLSVKPQLTHQAQLQPTDSAREIVETVVFVVVLVLLLKSFAAEAFVIPTGSMAQTLWGYQKVVKCPQCEIEFPVNCSNEVDPPDGPATRVDTCVCPNCRQAIKLTLPGDPPSTSPGTIPDPGWHSGDRVLVAKFVYDLLDRLPDRLDVVVFKFPGDSTFPTAGPIKKHVPINYIKRLIGLPRETIGILRGKLFVLSPEKAAEKGLVYDDVGQAGNDPAKKALLWRLENTHHNEAVKNFKDGDFEIIRKKPDNLLSMRRIVYDNDHQAKDLAGPEYQRWRPAEKAAWSASGKTAFSHDGTGNDSAIEWLHYKHILRGAPDKPQLITDVMGYNSGPERALEANRAGNWASDLMVECQVDVADPKGTFALEISRGPIRYQALFDLAQGTCSLYPIEFEKDSDGNFVRKGAAPTALKSAPTAAKKKGSYQLRFANIDDRLTMWVDDRLVFEDGVELPTPRTLVPTVENDRERPVSIGSRNAKVAVSKIKVFRDTYYTLAAGNATDLADFLPDSPKTWPALADVSPSTYYVQPGHFLCLGDNSPQSSDGRTWGLVPQRLLLGRALLVYYPFSRAGRIR